MIRKAFVMQVNPDTHQEYERRHNPIWPALAETEVCQRWRRHTTDVMPANADNSPVSAPLRQVFYLE
ncbi:MAG: L-rhamnose mutarotase [Sodalis sp. (in: enterobacteria)]|uniref:L-rhamnose mutarotase n=1 Tax=Sodalis sp. (in: enterobacteria) TaxID=1898979 RepID=UPI003F384E02